MMRPQYMQVSGRDGRPGVSLVQLGGLLLGVTILSPVATAQPIGGAATLDKVHVVSSDSYQFPLTTSSDKKIVNVPTQPEGRTVSGEILCNMQTQAELHNWYPFRYYMYKRVGGQLQLIKGGGLGTNKHTYAYTATKSDETNNATYVFSAHLNHAQVTGQCSLTVKVTEAVKMNVAPKNIQRLPTQESPKVKRLPRPPQ